MQFKNQFKNNVTRLLDSKKIAYRLHFYDYDAGVESAVQVADAIGLLKLANARLARLSHLA